MALRFIIGNSGAGKSYTAFQHVIREAGKHPDIIYYVIVPEQFTMQTQKTLVEMHPDKGILNIDVLSFERLAFRVLEEVGGDMRRILEETGKNMVLQKLVQIHQKDLVYLKNQMKKPGYLDEVKSLISEFMQYEVDREELDRMQERCGDQVLLSMKLTGNIRLSDEKCLALLYGLSNHAEDHYTLRKISKRTGGFRILHEPDPLLKYIQRQILRRVLSQLLYHLGRWIYLADARDDLEEDRQAAHYNPVAARFGPQGDDEALGQTMQRSLELAGAAFQLGEFGCRTPILENILYLGLPLVQRAVFDGSWAQIKKQKIWRSSQ